MASVHDVAAYILHKTGKITAVKLQKLLYYCQAWHLVWDDEPLFHAKIEAWANGPVVPQIYRLHRKDYYVCDWPEGDRSSLTPSERGTVRSILKHYGNKTSLWLSELTHRERPWRDARKGLDPLDRGNNEITQAAMERYYRSLLD